MMTMIRTRGWSVPAPGIRCCAPLIAVVLLLALPITAEERQNVFDLKPVAIFNQHLYSGEFNGPRGIAFDRRTNELWVVDSGNSLIGVFTPDGIPLFSFGAANHLRQPSRIAIDPYGRLFVIEGNHDKLKMFSYRGEYLGDVELPGLPEKAVIGAVAFDEDGTMYVGENSTAQVLVYDRELKLKKRFGSRGNGSGEFQAIAAIAIDSDYVYVVDHTAIAVQMFDKKGDYVRGWGEHDMGVPNFSLPEGIALDSQGHVIVVDALRHEVKYFDREGNFLDRFGGLGTRAGQISYPSGVAVDSKDRVYVVERGNSRVTVFEPYLLKH